MDQRIKYDREHQCQFAQICDSPFLPPLLFLPPSPPFPSALSLPSYLSSSPQFSFPFLFTFLPFFKGPLLRDKNLMSISFGLNQFLCFFQNYQIFLKCIFETLSFWTNNIAYGFLLNQSSQRAIYERKILANLRFIILIIDCFEFFCAGKNYFFWQKLTTIKMN